MVHNGSVRRFIFLPILVLLSLLAPKSALAKDYFFPKVEGTYTIGRDGTVSVVENRTYSFDGSFSWADIKIPLTVEREGYKYNASIENFEVLENGNVLYQGQNQNG